MNAILKHRHSDHVRRLRRRGMRIYRIQYRLGPGEDQDLRVFTCEAASACEASRLCRVAAPGCSVIGAAHGHPLLSVSEQMALLADLKAGDEVWWEDPDNSIESCYATVAEIRSEGREVTSDTIVTIAKESGPLIEVLAGELH